MLRSQSAPAAAGLVHSCWWVGWPGEREPHQSAVAVGVGWEGVEGDIVLQVDNVRYVVSNDHKTNFFSKNV